MSRRNPRIFVLYLHPENDNKEEFHMKTGFKARQTTLLGLLTAILLLMSYTPLGYLHIGPLAVTLNMIPVAVAAAALGPVGGAIIGAVFGLTSFLQCIGIGGISQLGSILFGIDPVRTFLVCFVPRVATGLLAGLAYRALCAAHRSAAAPVTGFLAAFLNTVFFMGMLVALFGRTEFLQGLIGGRNIVVFICTFVGLQAVFEMLASTLLTAALVKGLGKARVLER